jgi:uncharacterized protein YndB with AHSA1/START domain
MANLEASVVIARPVGEVFDFILAPEQHAPLIDPSVSTVLRTPEGPIGPGTTLRFQIQRNGKLEASNARVLAVEFPRRIGFEVEVGPVRPRCDLLLDPDAQGTRVTVRVDPSSLGKFRFLGGVFQKKAEQATSERLAKLKAVLESASESPLP